MDVAGVFTGDKGEDHFTTRFPYAVNANSANKRISWEFIKFIASEQTQIFYGTGGVTPINRKALERTSMINLTGKFEMKWEIPDDIKAMMNPVALSAIEELKKTEPNLTSDSAMGYEIYMAYMNKFANMITAYIIEDSTVNGMVNEEAAAYFGGEKTAEEAAETLQNKIDFYLNE